jgi:hypothetical protein
MTRSSISRLLLPRRRRRRRRRITLVLRYVLGRSGRRRIGKHRSGRLARARLTRMNRAGRIERVESLNILESSEGAVGRFEVGTRSGWDPRAKHGQSR